MGVLQFSKVTKSYGDNLILDEVSFEIYENEKVALIGRNGCGKTTIFNILDGTLDYDSGDCHIQKGFNIAYLKQIHDDQVYLKGMEMLKSAFSHIDELQQKMNNAHKKMEQNPQSKSIIKEYGRLHDKFEFMGGYNITEKIAKIITGLKIPEKVLNTIFKNLSGGEQTTIMLAKALLSVPDILLLDEPTNHLDMDACKWLESYISNYKGTVLYVSHDRYFINKTAEKVIDISFNKAKTYKGNYEAYLLQKKDDDERTYKLYESQQKEIERLMATSRQMRSYGTEIAVKRAKNLERRIEQMDLVDKPKVQRNLSLNFFESKKSGYEMVKVTKLEKSYNGNVVFENVEFLIKSGDRVGIIGPNGAGKSTLVRILTKNEKADEGEVKIGKSVKYAYLEQEVTFENEDKTVLEEVCDKLKFTLQSGRNILGKYMFSNEDVFKKIGMLSGGEKSRLRLLLEMQKDINLLILDEPTNHLDITSREQLEHSISLFNGTIIFISHDRHFINKFAKTIFDVRNQKVIKYNGNYDFYIKVIESNKETEQVSKVKEKNIVYGKKKRKAVFTIKQLEKTIEQQEVELNEIDEEIIQNATDYKLLNELTTKREQVFDKHEKAVEKWMELSEQANENS